MFGRVLAAAKKGAKGWAKIPNHCDYFIGWSPFPRSNLQKLFMTSLKG
jgi:hypothetical protein